MISVCLTPTQMLPKCLQRLALAASHDQSELNELRMSHVLFESKRNLLNMLLNTTRFQRVHNNSIQCACLHCTASCQIFIRHVTRENVDQFAS